MVEPGRSGPLPSDAVGSGPYQLLSSNGLTLGSVGRGVMLKRYFASGLIRAGSMALSLPP